MYQVCADAVDCLPRLSSLCSSTSHRCYIYDGSRLTRHTKPRCAAVELTEKTHFQDFSSRSHIKRKQMRGEEGTIPISWLLCYCFFGKRAKNRLTVLRFYFRNLPRRMKTKRIFMKFYVSRRSFSGGKVLQTYETIVKFNIPSFSRGKAEMWQQLGVALVITMKSLFMLLSYFSSFLFFKRVNHPMFFAFASAFHEMPKPCSHAQSISFDMFNFSLKATRAGLRAWKPQFYVIYATINSHWWPTLPPFFFFSSTALAAQTARNLTFARLFVETKSLS